MDDELRRRARAARAEVEHQVDVEAELAGRPTTSDTAPVIPLPPRGRIVAVTGSIAAVAVAIVGGVVLFGGSDSIETSEPSAPIVATSDLSPSPETTGPAPTTTTPGSEVRPTTSDATATSTSTTVPDSTTTFTTTTTPAPSTTGPTTPGRPTTAVPWRNLRSEYAGIDRVCSDVEFEGCTQLLVDLDGTVVSYDPTTRSLTRHSTPPITTEVDDDLGLVYLELLAPDRVVYLNVDAASPADGAADLVAMSLAPDDAGRELARWSDVTDRIGDNDLVSTREGIVRIGCCDAARLRPAPGTEVAVPWIGRAGQEGALTGPVIRTEVEYPELTVHRDDLPTSTVSWTFEPPPDWQPRGMPTVLPTFDGGFIATTFDGVDQTVIRGWVDGTIEMITIDTAPESASLSLDPNGRAITADDDHFTRFEPVADRTEYWAGRPEIGNDGNVTLPDIDTALDDGAAWSHDPVALGNAVAGRPEVNELRTIELVQQSDFEFDVTVTTSNHFDDSVVATRLELTLNRDDNGVFRFVSGRQTAACQPGRGHEDFSTELCV